MMDMTGHVHLFDKDELRSWQTSRESLMPAYTPSMLSDQELRDIVAYLMSVAAN